MSADPPAYLGLSSLMKISRFLVPVVIALAIPPLCWAADNLPSTIDPAKVDNDEDYQAQGEYLGELDEAKIGLQVIALGGGKFEAVLCHGGLPGEGWDGEKPRERMEGKRDREGVLSFTHEEWIGVLENDAIQVRHESDPDRGFVLSRQDRKSPTLGMAPPEGAIVLFDGTRETTEGHWEKAKLDGDLLREGALSKKEFTDFTLHLEFLLPWKPKARGQGRGNSGLYVTGRYEVQILDSFGLAGKDNECGGIYKVAEPAQNLCYPPLRWQTYDVDFTSAKFDADGKKTANARLTVKHNGFPIHEDLEIPGPTGGARNKDESVPGPIFLQNHGNPVRFRNIWVVEK